jgi:16S rRNA (guanine527-N7)-methyltransferase
LTEEEARAWLTEHLAVSRETLNQLDGYVELVHVAQKDQNLVSASTLSIFWARHIVDSAQLILSANTGSWLDIGSGAGVPGIVTAILTGEPTILVEPRAKRAAFLLDVVENLGLRHVRVVSTTVQKLVAKPVDNITARAVATLPAIIDMAIDFSHEGTVWLLPKGKSAQSELASWPRAWQGQWEVRVSVTDPDSHILIGRHIKVTK